jgi:RimJ/RimL family protein N-acetyltransferase
MGRRHDGTLPMITDGRVYLRAAEREDITLFLEWFSDWDTTRTLALRAPMSRPMEERWFDRMLEAQGHDQYFFVACLLEDDRVIGNTALLELDIYNGSAGLGITIGKAADRGKGFGGEMLRAILRFGFGQLRLERVWLDVYADNAGTRHVYERVGFTIEGTLRHAAFREGKWLDLDRMAILADEWRALDAGARA